MKNVAGTDDDEVREEAQRLIDRHGRRAQQVVVDEIVAAIRAGEDARAVGWGTVLRAIDLAEQGQLTGR